jgi:AcrR family transcriptional regulator
MPRIPPRERLTALAEAATKVFGRLGYRGTRMADVAAEAGMSSGSVFTYVESKEALFHLVFAHGFGHLDGALPALPLTTPAPGETVGLIEQSLRSLPVPKLRAVLDTADPPDVGVELRGIVEERYTMFESLWPVLTVIERCAVDVPELEEFYFQRARIGFFGRLAHYLEERASHGYLRTTPDAAVTARIVSESIAWFAWHRHQGRDALLYDDDIVRRSVVEYICAALVEPGP